MASNRESYKEMDIGGEIPDNPHDLRLCKDALKAALKDSKSLTIYILPINKSTGKDLADTTLAARRMLAPALSYTGVDTMERHGNMIYQVRRDNLVHDFDFTLPEDSRIVLLPHPTGYMRADTEGIDSPRFTVGAIDFQVKEFTAVEF